MSDYDIIMAELRSLGNEEKRRVLSGFFKTGKGEYGEGDMFFGIPVPLTRGVAKRHKTADMATVETLLASEWHEARLCALLILVEKMKKADADSAKDIVETYLASTARINNWDLVDLSASYIVGAYLLDKPRDLLYRLADSDLLWDNRIAMVSTYAFIKRGDLDDTFALALRLISHPHELMHKAVGWMLREAGKRVSEAGEIAYLSGSAPVPAGKGEFCEPFIRKQPARRYEVMPRAMLRYAVERLPAGDRSRLLSR